MTNLPVNFKADVEAISSIGAIPSILEVICRTTGMGFAAVARVTEDRWVACAVRDEIKFGLEPGGELKVETTICHEIRQSGVEVVIDHVIEDVHYCQHHTPALYGFQSYISVPIVRKDGSFFGTLCSIDPRPAKLNTPETIKMFKLFADLIAFHLNSIDELAASKSKLQEELLNSELREQFIAILGHDLRNPVSAIANVAQLLLRMPFEDRVMRLAHILKDSTYRIKGLIDNLLDFARGRLGDGIEINRDNAPLEPVITHVIAELDMIWPNRTINADIKLQEPLYCDSKRIAQLFSNLLSNALTHGDKDAPVHVTASSANGEFVLSVTNRGQQIPDAILQRLFQPFVRGEVEPRKQGLGLGLYIASEIARAHNGEIEVSSTPEQTSFTLRMPSRAQFEEGEAPAN